MLRKYVHLPSSRPFPPSARFRSLVPSDTASLPVFLGAAFDGSWLSAGVPVVAVLVAAVWVAAGAGCEEATALALASWASFLCCQILTDGGGATLSSLGGSFEAAAFSEDLDFFFPPSGFSFGFSAGASTPEACDCLSQVDSDVPLGVFEVSSSFPSADVDTVPTLGEDAPETSGFGLAEGAGSESFSVIVFSGSRGSSLSVVAGSAFV